MGTIWLTDLPDVIAAAGLKVTAWPGWETRSNKRGGYDAIYGIAVHHTAGNGDAPNDCKYMWDNAPLRPIGAIHLARDGSVTVGAAGQTNCQGLGGPLTTSRGTIPKDRGNSYAIAIEAANAGTGEPWPQPQQDAYVRLCAALCRGYDLQPADVFAHFEWAPTRKIDPFGPSRYAGMSKWDMGAFRADVANAMAQPPQPEHEDDMKTLPAPIRLYDSRDPGRARIKAGEIVKIPIFANVVDVNITVVRPDGEGYLVAWGENPKPPTSNVSFQAGVTIANRARVDLDEGTLRLQPTQGCHLIVDQQAQG